MSSALHSEPERDQFRSESPIRAFTEWQVQGLYALGKGFRPSLQHVVSYMHAMESKEGWRLVQILEATSQTPSFLFRQHRPPSDEELVLRLDNEGLRQQLRDLLEECDGPYIRNREGFEEAGRKIEQAVKLNAEMDCEHAGPLTTHQLGGGEAVTFCASCGRNIEIDGEVQSYAPQASADTWSADIDNKPQADDPIHVPVDLHEEALRFVADERGMDADRLVTDFMLYFKERNQPNQVSHRTFYQQLRFILPAAHELELKQLIREFLESNKKSQDDPVNPKHYNGRACADIGERLSANGYQVLKYCWRLGKKDDPCQELGKALWYLESEISLLGHFPTGHRVYPKTIGIGDAHSFLVSRLVDQPDFTQTVASRLWVGYSARDLVALRDVIRAHRDGLECGNTLAV